MVIWWYAGLRNQFLPDNFGVVEPGKIYRSAQISKRVLPGTLRDNNIKVIIDLSQEDSADAQAEKKIAADLGVRRIVITGLSGKGIGRADAYPEAIEAIVQANREGKAVLVHCQSGRSERAAWWRFIEGSFRPKAKPRLLPRPGAFITATARIRILSPLLSSICRNGKPGLKASILHRREKKCPAIERI